MKYLILFLFSINCYAGVLPDNTMTPGDIRTTDINIITSTKTSDVRSVSAATRKKVFAAYNLPNNSRVECAQGYEVDHLVSLSLGGSNSIKNLWPQSYCGDWNAHTKDALESRLVSLIKKKQITPMQAQSCIASNWIECYKHYFNTK